MEKEVPRFLSSLELNGLRVTPSLDTSSTTKGRILSGPRFFAACTNTSTGLRVCLMPHKPFDGWLPKIVGY